MDGKFFGPSAQFLETGRLPMYLDITDMFMGFS